MPVRQPCVEAVLLGLECPSWSHGFQAVLLAADVIFYLQFFFSLNDMFRRNAIYMKQAEGRMKASRQKRRRGPYLLPPVSPGS